MQKLIVIDKESGEELTILSECAELKAQQVAKEIQAQYNINCQKATDSSDTFLLREDSSCGNLVFGVYLFEFFNDAEGESAMVSFTVGNDITAVVVNKDKLLFKKSFEIIDAVSAVEEAMAIIDQVCS